MRLTNRFLFILGIFLFFSSLRFVEVNFLQKSTNRRSRDNDYGEDVTSSYDDGDVTDYVNKTWLRLREEFLGATDRHFKVLVVAYMRSGSTVTSSILTAGRNESVYWFEPVLPYYSSLFGSVTMTANTGYRVKQQLEQRLSGESVSELLHRLFTCHVDSLPIELFTHKFTAYSSVRPAVECIRNVSNYTSNLKPLALCFLHLSNVCNNEHSVARLRACSALIRAFESQDLSNRTDRTSLDIEMILRSVDPAGSAELAQRLLVDGNLSSQSLPQLFDSHRRCLRQLRSHAVHNNCLQPVVSLCQQEEQFNVTKVDRGGHSGTLFKRRVIVVKEIRVSMESIEEAMRQMPDLSVIHLVRDPRAAAVSRRDGEGNDPGLTPEEARLNIVRELCARMLADLRGRRRLNSTFPGSVLEVRYEEFVSRPLEVARRMYRHVGVDVTAGKLEAWIAGHMGAGDSVRNSGKPDDEMDIRRENPRSHVSEWRTKVKVEELERMNRHCRILLQELNYET